MKEALKRGRWTFPAPLGYRNVHRPDGSKTIEPDTEVAPLVRRAFELYAKGIHSKREVLEQVTILGLRTKLGNKMSP
jgi:site-specific DNA recombinase